jgi:hypothetical protein
MTQVVFFKIWEFSVASASVFSLSRGERVTRVRRFHRPARVG